MTREALCGAAALVVLLVGAVQSFGCSNCGEPKSLEAGSFRIVQAHEGTEEWLADALIDGQLDLDREDGVATVQYVREGTTYEVRFTIEAWP